MNKPKEKNSRKLVSWQPCKSARLLQTYAGESSSACSKIMSRSHRHQTHPSEVSPSPATWLDVEKGKAEWFTLRSNVGGHQDSRFIGRKSITAPLLSNPSSSSMGVRGRQAASRQQDRSLRLLTTISTLFFQTCKVSAVLSVTITSYKALLRRKNNRGASETW